MTKVHYPAILERARDGGYGVWFPDLPGCTSGGDSLEQAARNAIEALTLHLRGMAEDGAPIPPPGKLPKPPRGDGDAVVIVPADLPGKVERVNVTMDAAVLAAADRLAADHGTSRSGLFTMLIRDALHARRDATHAPKRTARKERRA